MKPTRTLSALALLALTLTFAAGAGYTGDAKEVSRSRGVNGGAVVLWPRVVPDDPSLDHLAEVVQQKLLDATGQALPDVHIDVRPSPQRLCPPEGCKGVAVGALISHKEGGCAVVATIGAPHNGKVKLLAWGGDMKLKGDSILPESTAEKQVQVTDFAPCESIGEALDPTLLKAAIAAGATTTP
jgi:hypothetical protein